MKTEMENLGKILGENAYESRYSYQDKSSDEVTNKILKKLSKIQSRKKRHF